MIVSKKDWHYKLYAFWMTCLNFDRNGPLMLYDLILRKESLDQPNTPPDLCRYFWSIVGLTIVSIIIFPILTALVAIVFLVGGILYLGTLPVRKYRASETHRVRQGKRKQARHEAYLRRQENPGLIWTFIKSKKHRVCPLIELID